MSKYRNEILIGDFSLLEYLSEKLDPHDEEQPDYSIVEDAIATLTADEQEVYYLRFGENMSIRKIAKTMGYSSHQIIQVRINRIKEKVAAYLKEHS